MLLNFEISEDSYQLFAAKAYQKSINLSTEEFLQDLKSVERLKSDITRWGNDKDDKQLRLIINKIVTFCNMFGNIPTIKLLFWKNRKDPNTTNFLMTLLIFLGIMPEYKLVISNGLTIDPADFQTNRDLVESLESIFK
jgi:hypothetical protein